MTTIESDGFYYLGKTRDLMRLGDRINPGNEPAKWGKIMKREAPKGSGRIVESIYSKGVKHEAKS